MSFSKDLNAASATPLILSILQQEESYGYQIIKKVEMISGGELMWAEGMLYPILHRLEKQGLIESFWQIPKTGRKRKYYRLKEAGVESLELQKHQWSTMNEIMHRCWGAGDLSHS